MINKEIGLNERKKIQLEMLKEIDAFCKENGIRYSLAFGTLLGAIRHNGFIPWDDDLDIMMPLPDMLKFKSIFKSENLKFCDSDKEKGYDLDFPRIANRKTFKLIGKKRRTYGVAIDLYVLVSIPDDKDNQNIYFKKIERYEKKLKFLRKIRQKIIGRIPILTIPQIKRVVRRLRDFEFYSQPYSSTNTYYMIAGPVAIKEKFIYDHDIFEELQEHKFEDGLFPIISSYHEFLTKRYGDYMQLPPESERHPYHNASFYWQ